MKYLLLISMLLASSAAWAQAYRWVDEAGVTHYSDSPPPDAVDGDSQRLVETRQIKADKLPQANRMIDEQAEDTQPDAESTVAEPAPPAQPAELDCATAVANTTSELTEAIAEQRAQMQAGQISRSTYQSNRDESLTIQRTVSEAHCRSANGETRAFYRCMSGEQHNLSQCREQHPADFSD